MQKLGSNWRCGALLAALLGALAGGIEPAAAQSALKGHEAMVLARIWEGEKLCKYGLDLQKWTEFVDQHADPAAVERHRQEYAEWMPSSDKSVWCKTLRLAAEKRKLLVTPNYSAALTEEERTSATELLVITHGLLKCGYDIDLQRSINYAKQNVDMAVFYDQFMPIALNMPSDIAPESCLRMEQAARMRGLYP